MRGQPERDMVSLRMMGWGLVVVGKFFRRRRRRRRRRRHLGVDPKKLGICSTNIEHCHFFPGSVFET